MGPHRRQFETLLSADVGLCSGALVPVGACVTRSARPIEYASEGVEGDQRHGGGQMVLNRRESFGGRRNTFLSAQPSDCFGF